jgi:anti-anti-sigma factor
LEQLQIFPTEDPHGLRLSGEIDMSTAPMLQDALTSAMAGGQRVTLDMRDVGFIDSSGLQVILTSAKDANPSTLLTIKDPSSAVRRVMELFGMEAIPQIAVSTADDAG